MFRGLSLEHPDVWDVLGSPILCFLFETAQKKVAYLGSCVFERGCVGLPVGLPNKARNTQKGSFFEALSKVAERMKIMPLEMNQEMVPKEGPKTWMLCIPFLADESNFSKGVEGVVVEVEDFYTRNLTPQKTKII